MRYRWQLAGLWVLNLIALIASNKPIGILGVIFAAALLTIVLEPLLTYFNRIVSKSPRLKTVLASVWFPIGLFFVIYSVLTLIRHYNLQSHAYDLGIFTQVVYNYAHFNGTYSSIRGVNILSDHFHPILAALAPLWWLWPSANMLLVFQAAVIAIGGWAVYQIAIHLLGDKRAAYAFTLAYLMFPGIQAGFGFDFHEIMIFPAAMLFLIYAALKKKPVLYWIIFFLIMLIKENTPIYLFFWSLFWGIYSKEWKKAFLGCFISIVMFIAVTKFLMPALPYASMYKVGYFDFKNLGATPGQAILNIVLHPISTLHIFFSPEIKRYTMMILISSVVLLPFFSPLIIVAIIPMLFEQFIFDVEAHWTLLYHYAVAISAPLTFGAILGYKNLLNKNIKLPSNFWPKFLPLFIVIGALCLTLNQRLLLVNIIKPSYYRIDKSAITAISLADNNIPTNASVLGGEAIVAHLAGRSNIVAWPPATADNSRQFNQEYIVLTTAGSLWPYDDAGGVIKLAHQFNTENGYGVYALSSDKHTVILKRNSANKMPLDLQ